jgi:hypothetical protein
MTTGTQNLPPDVPGANDHLPEAAGTGTGTPESALPAGTGTAGPVVQLPGSQKVTGLWWLAAIVAVVSAGWLAVVAARGLGA